MAGYYLVLLVFGMPLLMDHPLRVGFGVTSALPVAAVNHYVPGQVHVYIRPGETPLEEIDQDLAEAFLVHDRKNGRNLPHDEEVKTTTTAPRRPNHIFIPVAVGVSYEDSPSHIQKIPVSTRLNYSPTHF